jgi:TRAP transporter 4TM/12TM fusion protein
MGAAAFLMAEFTNIPYGRIALAAVIPAVLYFFSCFTQVHFEAKKLGLRGMKKEELPKARDILLRRGYLILPLVVIIWLLTTGATPMKAAMWAIIISVAIAIVVSLVNVAMKRGATFTFKDIVDSLESGARGALGVIAACACAGIIIGVITQTGLGLKLGEVLIGLAGDKLILLLIFTMITSLILGMGVPTTANYVITSTIAAPAIIGFLCMKAGISTTVAPDSIVLPAHMFAFYFGVLADITPPVALAAFAGAAIAKSNPLKTGVQATKLGIAAFIIPFIFVFNPEMLLFGVEGHALSMIWMIVSAVIGIVALAAGVEGFFLTRMNWIERVLLVGGGLGLVTPGLLTDAIGAAAILVALLWEIRKKKGGTGAPLENPA